MMIIVTVAEYQRVLAFALQCIKQNEAIDASHALFLDIPFELLLSLYNQLCVRRIEKSSFHDEGLRKIFHHLDRSQSIRDVFNSYKLRIGSYRIAKLYLENRFKLTHPINQFLENPLLVENEITRKELLRMITEDPNHSIEAELIKESIGKNYENHLIDMVTKRHMCFETEEESRSKGKPKTPDILFLIPMATIRTKYDPAEIAFSHGRENLTSSVSSSSSSATSSSSSSQTLQNINLQSNDYVVINWIDSKAMFADQETFEEHLKQLESYRNRYGRGMVIYWHGLVENIFDILKDDMILVRDHFPEDWIFPTGEVADGSIPSFDLIEL
jgi:hypothetical protein